MQTGIPAKNCILNEERIFRATRRMAFQIAENNAEEEEIIIAGIAGNGSCCGCQNNDGINTDHKLPRYADYCRNK
jgi:pyrimidine operon attenuation protein/uracil phosphoribosyltransferase